MPVTRINETRSAFPAYCDLEVTPSRSGVPLPSNNIINDDLFLPSTVFKLVEEQMTQMNEKQAKVSAGAFCCLLTLSSVHGQLSHACPFLRRPAPVTEAEGQSITITGY